MLPPAPVTFSTTTALPQVLASRSADRREVTSGATPGEKPTRMRTVCSGQVGCASAGAAATRIDKAAIALAAFTLLLNALVFSNTAVLAIPHTERSRASRADRSPLLKRHSRPVASADLSVGFVSPK